MTDEQPRTDATSRERSPDHQYTLSIGQTAELYAKRKTITTTGAELWCNFRCSGSVAGFAGSRKHATETGPTHRHGARCLRDRSCRRGHRLAGTGGFELSDPEKPPLEHGLTATEGRSARHISLQNGPDWGASHSLAAQPGKVSDRQTFRNEGKFGPHFKGQFWKRHL
jgi:hypothetical protein